MMERCELIMIILKTNSEMKVTFERLIKTMKEPVEWSGRFVVVGDYLILHGRVRSLFFNFESRKVVTNIIDIPVDEETVIDIQDHTKVQNVLNLVLYAFGKWGMIRGVKVDQDYAELNTLFNGVLEGLSVEPGYTRENFRFFSGGIRVSYEDVVQYAIDAQQDYTGMAENEVAESQGLWHKLVWKRQKASFPQKETTFEERQKDRIGNNFYMVGFQCPKCQSPLHMTVFPVGDEFRVETLEGGVFLARAYTCTRCNCFYTPAPEKLLAEGDVLVMDFLEDQRAYEDYLELLGQAGDRVSNYKFNEFEAMRKRREPSRTENGEESLEELCNHMEKLSDEKLSNIAEKMEEGFYPVRSVQWLEGTVQREVKKRRIDPLIPKTPHTKKQQRANMPAMGTLTLGRPQASAGMPSGEAGGISNVYGSTKEPPQEIPVTRREAAQKRYKAKCGILDRLSHSQVTELKNQLLHDTSLYDVEKKPFLNAIENKERQYLNQYIQKLAAGCMDQNYVKIRRVIEEVEKAALPKEDKAPVLEPLYTRLKKKGEAEVRLLIQKMPEQIDMKQYRDYMKRLKGYTGVDLAPYEKFLGDKMKQAQKREINHMIRHARIADRQGLTDLMERLKSQQYDSEVLAPYLERIEFKLREADEKAIEEICGNTMQMSAAEALEAYRKIEEGVFLPELKTNALEMLKKRLLKLKTDECELLVHKLKDNLKGRIKEYDRFYYYPARKVLSGHAEPEELQVIEYALGTYGTTLGEFEYPILVVDTSRDRSGKEGIILTPEHLFFRTMMTAYVLDIEDIKRVHSQNGFFNTGLFVEISDGTKMKIPYAVDKKELTAWGNCLEEFIRYLQEKPESRKMPYLSQEKHETICCFRCGFTYKGGDVCPKCGYKMNQ